MLHCLNILILDTLNLYNLVIILVLFSDTDNLSIVTSWSIYDIKI